MSRIPHTCTKTVDRAKEDAETLGHAVPRAVIFEVYRGATWAAAKAARVRCSNTAPSATPPCALQLPGGRFCFVIARYSTRLFIPVPDKVINTSHDPGEFGSVPMRVLGRASSGTCERGRRDQQGTIAIVVAAATLAIFGLAAIVVDFGTAYGHQRNLQNAADAASLAAGGVILQNSEAGRHLLGDDRPGCSL